MYIKANKTTEQSTHDTPMRSRCLLRVLSRVGPVVLHASAAVRLAAALWRCHASAVPE